MTLLELFNENCAAGYQNTRSKVSWKIVDRRFHYQGSVEPEDWCRNFLPIPWPTRIRGVWCWISLGVLLAWWETRRQALEAEIDIAVGYSAGSPPTAILAVARGIPGIAFGCPRFLWWPSSRTLALFDTVEFIDSPGDIVTLVPGGARRGSRTRELGGTAVCPDKYDRVLWATRHSMEEYRQRLAFE